MWMMNGSKTGAFCVANRPQASVMMSFACLPPRQGGRSPGRGLGNNIVEI